MRPAAVAGPETRARRAGAPAGAPLVYAPAAPYLEGDRSHTQEARLSSSADSGSAPAPTPAPELGAALRERLESLFDEGMEIWSLFDAEVRQQNWHPFVPADYHRVLETLLALRAPGVRFLEWGSATGVITITADLLGYDAYGIELDGPLVRIARAVRPLHARVPSPGWRCPGSRSPSPPWSCSGWR